MGKPYYVHILVELLHVNLEPAPPYNIQHIILEIGKRNAKNSSRDRDN
jgi:hypothetical protein